MMPPAQIDEKYVLFVREFSKYAFEKRYKGTYSDFVSELKAQGEEPTHEKFKLKLYEAECKSIASLDSGNVGDLSNSLAVETFDYGLSLYWQACLDEQSPGTPPLSNEHHELAI